MNAMAAALALMLAFAVLTLWMPGRLAWGIFQFAVFAAAAAWLIRQIREKRPVLLSRWMAPLAAAACWGLLQLATQHTVYRWETWNAVLNWTTYLVLFFLSVQCLQRSHDRLRFLRWILYFGFGLAVLSTLQTFTSHGRIFWLFASGYTENVMGPFVYHNEYAAFMELIVPIALWSALCDRRRSLAYCLMAALIFASVVASASRAGTLIVFIEMAAFAFLAWRRAGIPGAIVLRGIALLVVAAFLFSAVVGFAPLWRRFAESDLYSGRRQFVVASLAMVHDRPIWGSGLGTWPYVYPGYALFDDGLVVTQAHNDWVQWAAEGGLPYFFIFACLAVMTTRPAVRSLWALGLPAVWLHCAVDYLFHQRPGLAACIFVLLALLAAEDRCLKRHAAEARVHSRRHPAPPLRLVTQILSMLHCRNSGNLGIVVRHRSQHAGAGEIDHRETSLHLPVLMAQQQALPRYGRGD